MEKTNSYNIDNMEIMVVDDTPDNLRLLTEILKKQKYKVRPVPNGKLALAAVKASLPDLILLDINMPGLNGYEVCSELKSNNKTKDIPVIFLSAMSETIDKVKAFQVGGIDYITKPFHVEEVLARVETHLKLHLLKTELEQTNLNLEKLVEEKTKELLNMHKARQRLEFELKVAKEVQSSMKPNPDVLSDCKKVSICADSKPARHVGGDFYDYFKIDKNRIFFCLGDVSGKGIPAAIFMAVIRTLFKVEVKRKETLEEIILSVNAILLEDNDTCMFASVVCGIIDIETGNLTYCNAGHTKPLFSRHSKEYEYVPGNKDPVLGVLSAEPGDYTIEEFKLLPSDRLFFYSDGVTEAINTKNEQFSEERLKKTLDETREMKLNEILNKIKFTVKDHVKGAGRSDDITVMVLEYK